MTSAQFSAEVRQLEEKQSSFRGSAKIQLKHLSFDDDIDHMPNGLYSHLDPKNVDRLEEIFRLEGCQRLEEEHRIAATIDDQVLEEALGRSALTKASLVQQSDPPELKFEATTTLRCLNGKHRIAAAQRVLVVGDKWWIVDLYTSGLHPNIQTNLREEYANERNFCDGDIFRNLRLCQNRNNKAGEKRWLARLSECKRKDIKQLQRRDQLEPIRLALDGLLDIVGLWPALQIGMFHRILSLRCPEELQHYLNHVKKQWIHILGNDDLQSLVDFRTVQLLQTRNPRLSSDDHRFVAQEMNRHALFPLITDVSVRLRILENLETVPCSIPSLYTFLEDTKWLEAPLKAMRGLLPSKCRENTRAAFLQRYTGTGQQDGLVQIQSKDLTFIEYRGTDLLNALCAYRQLWLYAWRNFPTLVPITPRKDSGKQKPQIKTLNEQCWRRMAQLANELGYEYPELAALQKQNPDAQMVMELLRQARPMEYYNLSNEILQPSVLSILRVLESIKERNPAASRLQTPYQGGDPGLEFRCGRPYESSHDVTRPLFFYQEVYQPHSSGYSHFMIHREIFHAFFGPEPLIEMSRESPVKSFQGQRMDIDNSEGQDQSKRNDSDPSTEIQSPIAHPEAQEPTLPTDEDQDQGSHDDSHAIFEPSSPLLNPPFRNVPLITEPPTPSNAIQNLNDAEKSIVDHLDREKTHALWESYTTHCSLNSIFFVIEATGDWRVFHQQDVTLSQDNIRNYTANFARHHVFLVYYARLRRYKSILVETIRAWSRNEEKSRDGVILVFKRPTSKLAVRENNLTGSFQPPTTKERLELIGKPIHNKRRQNKFGDEKIDRSDDTYNTVMSRKGKKRLKVTDVDSFQKTVNIGVE